MLNTSLEKNKSWVVLYVKIFFQTKTKRGKRTIYENIKIYMCFAH